MDLCTSKQRLPRSRNSRRLLLLASVTMLTGIPFLALLWGGPREWAVPRPLQTHDEAGIVVGVEEAVAHEADDRERSEPIQANDLQSGTLLTVFTVEEEGGGTAPHVPFVVTCFDETTPWPLRTFTEKTDHNGFFRSAEAVCQPIVRVSSLYGGTAEANRQLGSLRATLRIPPRRLVVGRVVDSEGKAICGATIRLSFDDSGRLMMPVGKSDAGGDFRLPVAGTPRLIGARKEGYADSFLLMVNGPREPQELNLVLGVARYSKSILVKNSSGSPCVGAKVFVGHERPAFLYDLQSKQRRAVPPGEEFITDETGIAIIQGLALRRNPVVVVAPGMTMFHDTLDFASRTDPVLILLRKSPIVEGHVWADGRTVADATILYGSYGSRTSVKTLSNDKGFFRLDGLPIGQIHLKAYAPKKDLQCAIVVDVLEGELLKWNPVLGPPSKGIGYVMNLYGSPVPNAVVRAYFELDGGGQRMVQTRTDQRGFYSLSPSVRQAVIQILLEKDGVPDSIPRSVTSVDYRKTRHASMTRIDDAPHRSLKGNVSVSCGYSPALTVSVTRHVDGSRQCLMAQVDPATGDWVAEGLPPGEYSAVIGVQRPQEQQRTIVLENRAIVVGEGTPNLCTPVHIWRERGRWLFRELGPKKGSSPWRLVQ